MRKILVVIFFLLLAIAGILLYLLVAERGNLESIQAQIPINTPIWMRFSAEYSSLENKAVGTRIIPEQTFVFLNTDGTVLQSNFEITCCVYSGYYTEEWKASPFFSYIVFGMKPENAQQYDSSTGRLLIYTAATKEFVELPADRAEYESSMWSLSEDILLLYSAGVFSTYDVTSKQSLYTAQAPWTEDRLYYLREVIDASRLLIEHADDSLFTTFDLKNGQVEDTPLTLVLNKLKEEGYEFRVIDLVGRTYAFSPDFSSILVVKDVGRSKELHHIDLKTMELTVVDSNTHTLMNNDREYILGFGDVQFSPSGNSYYYKKLEEKGEHVQLSGRFFIEGEYYIVANGKANKLKNIAPVGFLNDNFLLVGDDSEKFEDYSGLFVYKF